LSWCHACIYPLPADLFSIPAGLQALPTALLMIYLVFKRYIIERGDAENYDIFDIFFTDLEIIFYNCPSLRFRDGLFAKPTF
jgi:hypothetical protein